MEVVASEGVVRECVRFLPESSDDTYMLYSGSRWKVTPKRVKVPYAKYIHVITSFFLSTMGLVKPRGNLPGLSGKAKYTF